MPYITATPYHHDNLAYAKYKIRKLINAIQFAKTEPHFMPPQLDPDTGYYGPADHDEPFRLVNALAFEISEDPEACSIVEPYGWQYHDYAADLDTMLSHLPPVSAVTGITS